MQSKIHPTVPSPPHASTLNSGTSRKKFNLKTVNEDIYYANILWLKNIHLCECEQVNT